MRILSLAAAGVSLALIALTLAPSAGEYRAFLAIGAMICSAVALAAIAAGWRERSSAALRPELERPSVPVTRADAATRPTPGEAEVVSFLGTLQEKGRLVDFLQDDIAGYSDAQVGAAARVVHQGCKVVLNEYLHIVPVREESEGAKVTVPAGYGADQYRLVGKISGEAPFTGTLMHRGWKAESVNLPRVLRLPEDRLPAIAPAEVELR